MIITIDGPSGTGKSTVARAVAKKLGFTFFDTGAMYRSFAWLVLQKGMNPGNQEAVEALLSEFQFEIRSQGALEKSYFVGGVDVSSSIRSPSVTKAASEVAVYPEVRKALVAIQREVAQSTDAVFEGRDMGTVVFPSADLKIFLSASAEVRAERRYQELLHKFPDISIEKGDILKEIEARDQTDSTRKISPLKQARDAIYIDTSKLTVQQVVEKIVQLKPKRRFAKMKFFYKLIYSIARFFFKCCFRLKVYGLEHFRFGSAIIAANHTSLYDPPVLSISCPEEVHFLAKESLFRSFFLGTLIKNLNAHPVKRGASDTAVFKTILKLLSEGKKIILFPEGKRSSNGELLPIEKGLSFLIEKSHSMVIPAYIQGAFEAWPKGKSFPKLFGNMTVAFGSPILWEDLGDKKKSQARITQKTEEAIYRLKEWVEGGSLGSPP